jgi:O-antigen ligase
VRNGRETARSAVLLWAALLAGIVVAWSPRYWAVTVAITSLSLMTACWITASWVIRACLQRKGSVAFPPQTALAALIGAWGFLQIAFHATVLPQLTLDAAIVWALSACAFVLGSQILRDRAACDLFLELFLWSLTALAVIAMLQFYLTPTLVFGVFPAEPDVVGTFLSRNQFAALMELGAPVALWYIRNRNAAAGGLCYAMILAAAITAGSRAGIILIGVELLIFFGTTVFAYRRDIKLVLSLSVGLVLVVAVASMISGTDKIRARFEDKDPYAIRQQLFDSTLQLIAERPWFGSGMGTWRSVYPRTATFDAALLANEAHNDWAQWTSDGGIPFALLMAALVVWIAVPAVRSIWGLGVLSVMLHSYVDYPIREPALSFLWFALAGAVSQFRGVESGSKRPSRVHGHSIPGEIRGGERLFMK